MRSAPNIKGAGTFMFVCVLGTLALVGCGGPRPVAAKPDVDGCKGSWLRPVASNAAQVMPICAQTSRSLARRLITAQ